MRLVDKIKRYLLKLRLQPIRVFCFHQVSETFNPSTMWECDWTEIEQFKRNIIKLKEKYVFISLQEAYKKLKVDKIRSRKYAVLTSDDGWASLKEILPWLDEQNIPVTLFINPCYLDNKHFQERETEKLLIKEDLELITASYPLISLASHGWVHKDSTKLGLPEFEHNLIISEEALIKYHNKIPFYAFTYGRYDAKRLNIVRKHNLIPVFIDNIPNYKDSTCIHRDCIDGKIMK